MTFDHAKKQLARAMGISRKRAEEITNGVKNSMVEAFGTNYRIGRETSVSEQMEAVLLLVKPIDEVEAMYVGYVFTRFLQTLERTRISSSSIEKTFIKKKMKTKNRVN